MRNLKEDEHGLDITLIKTLVRNMWSVFIDHSSLLDAWLQSEVLSMKNRPLNLIYYYLEFLIFWMSFSRLPLFLLVQNLLVLPYSNYQASEKL